MHNAEHFDGEGGWISNNKRDLIEKIDNLYFKSVDEEQDDWNFPDEQNRFIGILNYFRYIWKFKYYYRGILYDRYKNEVFDEPSEDASYAAFNLHLVSNEEDGSRPFYAIFERNKDKNKVSDWYLISIIRINSESKYESIFRFSDDNSLSPEKLLRTRFPTHFVFNRFNTHHFFENRRRLPEDIRSCIYNTNEMSDKILKAIFVRYSKGDDDKYHYYNNNLGQNTVEEFEPNYLIEKWYAKAPKGGNPQTLLNPNTESFLYPICIDDNLVPDASLVFEKTQETEEEINFSGNTIYSLRESYRNAILLRGLNGMEDTWLSKDAVENSINRGCLD